MATWRDFLGTGAPTTGNLRFRPRLDSLDSRALPDAGPGDPPPDQPPADPAPEQSQLSGLAPGDWAYFASGDGNGLSVMVGDDGGVWAVTGSGSNPTFDYLGAVNTSARAGGPADILYDPERNPFGGVIGGIGTVPGVPTRPVPPAPPRPRPPQDVPPLVLPLPGGGRWDIRPQPNGSIDFQYIDPFGRPGNRMVVNPDGSIDVYPTGALHPIRIPAPSSTAPNS